MFRPNLILDKILPGFCTDSKMGGKVKFSASRSKSDPAQVPVMFIGQMKNLQKIGFAQVQNQLQPRVEEEYWNAALEMLNPSPTDTVNLYLNLASVSALPNKCSRHNTPSRAHAISKIVKANTSGQNETIVIVCDRADVYASGCAVARAFPTFSKKTNEKNQKPKPFIVNVEFICPDSDQELQQEELETLEHAAEGIQMAANIVDTPCNEMHTDGFIQRIKEVGQALEIVPNIIRGEELDKKGFGGIYGVGKAALHPPAMAVLSYTPPGATETIAWVGKGIVYDTGGLSIKGKTAMPGMKRDCGGAAGILGAFYAAVKSNFSQNLHAIFCLAENAVSDRATRPDDIHTLYSGKTVEINNTDAEGRLVVSDGVVYARKDLKANIIVDMCTLTGAQGISTGKYHAAHLTNNEDWEKHCFEAGKSSGDLSFPLVYCPEIHFAEFSSAVADMKNSVADRSNAQSSCAGLFINAHLGFDFPGVWLHIDMAYPVHSGERATGYGVALLNTLFGCYTGSTLLQESSPIFSINGDNSIEERGSKSKKMKRN